MPKGVIDRRHYELCALSELRDRLQVGDIWVTGRRLISVETMQELQQAGTLPIAVEGLCCMDRQQTLADPVFL